MIRKFKPGDRVQLKNEGPVMEVIKYITEHHPAVGPVLSDTDVECVWYEGGERCVEVFHQKRLSNVEGKGGIYRT